MKHISTGFSAKAAVLRFCTGSPKVCAVEEMPGTFLGILSGFRDGRSHTTCNSIISMKPSEENFIFTFTRSQSHTVSGLQTSLLLRVAFSYWISVISAFVQHTCSRVCSTAASTSVSMTSLDCCCPLPDRGEGQWPQNHEMHSEAIV